jgi:hypothetical protein
VPHHRFKSEIIDPIGCDAVGWFSSLAQFNKLAFSRGFSKWQRTEKDEL